jgi:serine/threonine protein kinase
VSGRRVGSLLDRTVPASSAWPPGMQALDDTDPRQIGRFTVLGLLGAGGMGRVYLARPIDRPDHPDARVAVKVIRPDLAGQPQVRDRFRREVATAARVNPQFTAQVVDADPDAPAPWLATRYLPGKTLSEEITDNGPLDTHRLRALALRLAQVLAALHNSGVVHRDLKPSNVLLTPDGPRLIDFGIAAALDLTSVTATGELIGTPAYMSPEQITATPPVGPPSDVFSLGGLLVTAATGRKPYPNATTPAALIYRIVHDQPNLTEIPGDLHDLIARCMAKDPAARPTAREIIDEILGVPAGASAPTLVTAETEQVDLPKPAPRRRRGLVAALDVIAATLAPGVLAWPLWPARHRRPSRHEQRSQPQRAEASSTSTTRPRSGWSPSSRRIPPALHHRATGDVRRAGRASAVRDVAGRLQRRVTARPPPPHRLHTSDNNPGLLVVGIRAARVEGSAAPTRRSTTRSIRSNARAAAASAGDSPSASPSGLARPS